MRSHTFFYPSRFYSISSSSLLSPSLSKVSSKRNLFFLSKSSSKIPFNRPSSSSPNSMNRTLLHVPSQNVPDYPPSLYPGVNFYLITEEELLTANRRSAVLPSLRKSLFTGAREGHNSPLLFENVRANPSHFTSLVITERYERQQGASKRARRRYTHGGCQEFIFASRIDIANNHISPSNCT